MIKAIDDAVHQLNRHRGLAKISNPQSEGETTIIEVDVKVELPSRCRGNGISITGVRATETCILSFGVDWPLSAPKVLLRKDFPLNLPHINPHSPGQYVSPCLFEGSLDEMLHRFGLDAIIDQLIDWLHKAAAGTLINFEQGWEPTRRDNCPSTIIFSAEQVSAIMPSDGSILKVRANYFAIDSGLYANLDPDLISQVNPISNPIKYDRDGKWSKGVAAAFILRTPNIIASYQPETVFDLETLLVRAEELGIGSTHLAKSLETYYNHSMLSGKYDPKGLYVIVVLVVNRPASLVGSPDRNAEMLPYVIRYDIQASLQSKPKAEVHPAFHSHKLSPKLLAYTSGLANANISKRVVIFGCGSLGSKIALHLGRAGFGNMAFVDNEYMSPHNAARHALIVDENLALPHKAELMEITFERLSHHNSRSLNDDAVSLLMNSTQFSDVISDDSPLIIDATASLKVLAAETTSVALNNSSARLVRVLMYGQGNCALIMLEAIERSSRVDDLTAALFERCRNDVDLRANIAGNSTEATAIFVGDNCRSLTVPMSDSTVSRSAALVSMQLERWLVDGLPDEAFLCYGVSDAQRIGMSWNSEAIASTTVIKVSEEGGWEIRVLHSVIQTIKLDVNQWGLNETGGALLGHISYETRTITIAGVVESPSDNIRGPACFVLGTDGLIQSLREAHEASLGYLTFIGTWHSHPRGGSHSRLDRKTLHHIAEDAGGLPAVSLVWTPDGLICAVEQW